jgi:hypothetical protein
MGSVAMPVLGTVAGWAAGLTLGFAAGFLSCPYLAPRIRRKLEGGFPLDMREVRQAADAMSQYASLTSAPDAVKLLAVVKAAPRGRAAACRDPAYVASALLKG